MVAPAFLVLDAEIAPIRRNCAEVTPDGAFLILSTAIEMNESGSAVMAGLVPAIHVVPLGRREEVTIDSSANDTTLGIKSGNRLSRTTAWMAGTSPASTTDAVSQTKPEIAPTGKP